LTKEQIDILKLQDVGFMDITDHPEDKFPKSPFSSKVVIPEAPSHQDVVVPLLADINQSRYLSINRGLAEFPDRKFNTNNGAEAAEWLYEQYQNVAEGQAGVSVSQWEHSNWVQTSVIGRIQGTSNADEVVIIGGHLDSTSFSTLAPGFDDDASGSATVLEVFTVLVQAGYRGSRTLEFHGYAAEEGGLLGSADIARNYRAQGINVIGMLQMDMTCYPGTDNRGNIGMTRDYTNAELTTFIKACVDEYTEASYVESTCGYGCSDHASWNNQGYPASFPFEASFGNHNPYIHTPNDVEAHCSIQHSMEFAQLALSFAVEMSS